MLNVSAGTYKPTILIGNSFGYSTQILEIRVSSSGNTSGKPIIISDGELDGVKHEFVTYTIEASGPEPITFNVVGQLPNGLSFNNGNIISGTPTVFGTFNVNLKATNFNGVTTRGLLIYISDDHPPE